MMEKQITLLIVFLGLSFQILSQDIEIYKKGKNDNYQLPKIGAELSFDEFELLSQNMRMKDMLYAAIVPGIIHFKAQEPKKGYWLVGLRSAAYTAVGYVLIASNEKYGNARTSSWKGSDKTLYQDLFYGGLALGAVTYLYDIIHGDYILHRKQEKIRYKYSLKLSSGISFFSGDIYPGVSLNLKF